ADLSWNVSVPAADWQALGNGELTVNASVTNAVGNTGSGTRDITIDASLPGLRVDTVAGDDVVNIIEHSQAQVITGSSSGFAAGTALTVVINNQTYAATVLANGSWSVGVPATDVSNWPAGTLNITVSGANSAGTQTSITHPLTVDLTTVAVSINSITSDDVINAAEKGAALTLSGSTSGVEAGQTVTITFGGKTYTTTVQTGGSWSYTLGSVDVTALADGNAYVINASVSNAIGNTGSSNHTITVDLSAPAMGINIDSLQADTGLSSSDFITSVSPVVVNGSLTAALASNETAQISIDGGVTWTTLTVTGTTWRYNDSRTLTDGSYLYQVRVIDAAGNVGATDSQNVVIDTIAPDPAVKTIAINAITTDTGLITNDFVTSDTTLAVSGTLGAALSSGEFAQISIDGGTTWQNLSVSGLTWTYLDGRTLSDGNYNYQVRVIDTAGNIGATASQIVTVDTTAPLASKTIAIAGISDDTG
ncbi:Ig-like domain-containing protein, partial [Escherichia coli]